MEHTRQVYVTVPSDALLEFGGGRRSVLSVWIGQQSHLSPDDTKTH